MMGNPREMKVGSGESTVRDFMVFQLKLAVDGVKDLVVFNVSIAAVVLDLLAGAGKRPRLFYTVVRASERFDEWLDLHGAAEPLPDVADVPDVPDAARVSWSR